MFGGDDSPSQVASAVGGEVSVVNVSTVADLLVIGLNGSGGLGATRDFEPGEASTDHNRQLKGLARLPDDERIIAVRSADDVQRAHTSDATGIFVSCEGADFLEGGLGGLAEAYELGARSIGLVHYRVNELGDIQTEDPVHGGLSAFGLDVVAEMNRLGIIIDMAHATFAATVAAVEASSQPLMISHSHLASAGSSHPRLLSEDHARVVADAGGLIGAWPSGVANESLADYSGEICRLVDLVGIGHVAIGSDMDANYKPVLTRYDQFPELALMLADRGLTSTDVDKVLGGNFVELFQNVVG